MTTPGQGRKRRTRGTGSVTRRRDGLWEGRISLGWDRGGRRVVSFYGKTKLEVEEKLSEERRARKRGEARAPVGMTVGRYLGDWEQQGCPGKHGGLRPYTLRRYRAVIEHQLIPHLGPIRLVELQPADVERMLQQLRSEGKAAYTAITVRSVLRSALSRAERNGLVSRNVAKLAGVESPPRVHPTVLTPAAVQLVLDACEPGLRRLVAISIDTGLRQAELLGLRWPDVDFEGRTLTVRETLQRVDREYVLGRPKSETSCRTVALSDLSLKALRDEREAQITARTVAGRRWRDSIPGLVFTTSLGAPRNGSSLTHALQKALHATGLRPLRWHDLRAIHGGLLVQAGVGMTTARDRLGHSSIAVTSTFYAGVVDELERDAAEKVGRLLGA